MSKMKVGRAPLIPVASQLITMENSTAQTLNGTMQASQVLLFSVETGNMRLMIGTGCSTVALTTGVLYKSTDPGPHWIDGYNRTSLIKMQRTTGTCNAQFNGFKYDA